MKASKSQKLKTSSSTVILRCPKDHYANTSRNQLSSKQTTSRTRLTYLSPTNRQKDQNSDPYLMKRPAEIQQPLASINEMRKKLKNIEFLQNCLYSQIGKIEQQNSAVKMSRAVESRYEQCVTDYDTLSSNVDQLAISIRKNQQTIRQMQTALTMTVADVQGRYLQRAQLLLELQDCQQLIESYKKQFQEQATLVFRELKLEQDLSQLDIRKRGIVAELEVLEAQKRYSEQDSERFKYFQQKINQLRVDLLDQQALLKPSLRQFICGFYNTHKQQKQLKEGIEIWIARMDHVESFKTYVISKKVYTGQALRNFEKYIDILDKIQIIFKKMYNNKEKIQFDRLQSSYHLVLQQYNTLTLQQNSIKTEISSIKDKLVKMHAQDKLYKIQSKDMNTRQLSQHLFKWDSQHQNRIKIIKNSEDRIKELTQKVKGKLPHPQDIENIKRIQAQLRHVKSETDKLRTKYIKLDRARRDKQYQFKKSKTSFTNRQQNIETVNILYKKVERLRQKKRQLSKKISERQVEASGYLSPKVTLKRQDTWNLTPCHATSREHLRREFDHPLEETIQKLKKLKDSIVGRTPVSSTYSRVIQI